MPRFVLLLACCSAALANAPAQSLREAVAILFAAGQQARATGPAAAWAGAPIIRGELLPQIKLDGSSNFPKPGQDGTAAGATEDLLSRQLSRSLQQWWLEGSGAFHCSPEEKHRRAMQEFLSMALLESRVVDLAALYLDLLRADRRIAEAKKNIALAEQIRAGSKQLDAQEMAQLDQWLADAQGDLTAQREAKREMQNRFQRLTGQAPALLSAPAVPAVPADRGELDLSQNWNFLAATEAVLAVGSGRAATARERLPALFLETCRDAGNSVEGSEDTIGRTVAWQTIKAHELCRAADLQRQYAISLLWREHQADAAAASSLRTQTGLLASVVAKNEQEYLAGRLPLKELLSLHERLAEFRARLIDTEASLSIHSFRILGVQGRCAEFVMGTKSLEGLLPDEWEKLRENGPQGETPSFSPDGTYADNFEIEVEDQRREGVLRALTRMSELKSSESREPLQGTVTWNQTNPRRVQSR